MISVILACSSFVVTATNGARSPLASFRTHVLSSAADDAKIAWLARLESDAWRSTAAAERTFDEGSVQHVDEEEAKKVWLASLAIPWGATATNEPIVEVAAKMTEQEAKMAWLQKLDTPLWGKTPKA